MNADDRALDRAAAAAGFNRKERAALARLNRRDFIGTSAAATLAALLGRGADARASENGTGGGFVRSPKATADTVIVLWMAGGMAQTETFDPKRYAPYSVGMRTDSVLSTFPTIDTAVDSIKFTQGLEKIGAVMDRGAIIRSFMAADLGFILHARHQYHWHTGYIPPQAIAMPHIGAVIAKTLGPKNPDVQAFIAIGQPVEGAGEIGTLKAFHTGGFLGTEYGPFLIPDPKDAAAAVRPPRDLGERRFQSRRQLFQSLLAKEPVYPLAGDFQRESMLRSLEAADRLLLSPAAKAFDLSLEPKESQDAYDIANNRFGQGCLLARRLAEAGARYIEVTTQYVPFVYWDTHERGHQTAETMKQTIDAPVAQLIRDLEARGLLDRTLVILASEFGRDAITEGKVGKVVKDQSRANMGEFITDPAQYGMHRHFTAAGSILMFGGGIKRGFIYGKTAEERPCTTIEDPMPVEDLHATIYHALGIPPDLAYIHEKRPVYVTKDGRGVVAEKLFRG